MLGYLIPHSFGSKGHHCDTALHFKPWERHGVALNLFPKFPSECLLPLGIRLKDRQEPSTLSQPQLASSPCLPRPPSQGSGLCFCLHAWGSCLISRV